MKITKLTEIIDAYDLAKGPFRKAFKTDATCIKNVKKLLGTTAPSLDDEISDCDVINCFLGPKNRPIEGSESQGAFHTIVAKIFPGQDASVIIRDHFSSQPRPINQELFETHKNRITDPLPAGATTASVPADTGALEIERLRDPGYSDLSVRVKKAEEASASHVEALKIITKSADATAAGLISISEQLQLALTEKERMTAENTVLLVQIEKLEKATQGVETRTAEWALTQASLEARVDALQKRNAELLQQLKEAKAVSTEVSSAALPLQSDISESVSSQVTAQTLFSPATTVPVEASSSEQQLSLSPTLSKAAVDE